ncbi:MAG: hypothetical protein P8Z78_06685 [Gammaproteobacteria bacterium]
MSEQVSSWSLPPLVVLPEREPQSTSLLERLESFVSAWPTEAGLGYRARRIAGALARQQDAYRQFSDTQLSGQMREVREKLRRHGHHSPCTEEGLALLREMLMRKSGMTVSREQIMAACALLDEALVESPEGDNMMVPIVMAAIIAGWSGMHVHLILADDDLIRHYLEQFRKIFEWCGLSAASIEHTSDLATRKHAYEGNLVLTTAKELAFDYLRDRLGRDEEQRNLAIKLRQLQGRARSSDSILSSGLQFALVHDADLVLLDDARAPVEIANSTDQQVERRWARKTLNAVASLTPGTDYILHDNDPGIELTSEGAARLEDLAEGVDGLWDSKHRREESILQGLAALHRLNRNDHYLVESGRVRIPDQRRAERLSGFPLRDGMLQLLQLKEGCDVTGRRETVATTTFMRLFQRYAHLSGISRTHHHIRHEYRTLYHLHRLQLISKRASRPVKSQPVIYKTVQEKRDALIERITDVSREGGKCIVCAATNEESAQLCEMFAHRQIDSQMLSEEMEDPLREMTLSLSENGTVVTTIPLLTRALALIDHNSRSVGPLYLFLVGASESRRDESRLNTLSRLSEGLMVIERLCSLDEPFFLDSGQSWLLRLLASQNPVVASIHGHLLSRMQHREEKKSMRLRRALMKRDQSIHSFISYRGNIR